MSVFSSMPMRSFSTNSFYIWTAMPKLGPKASDLKQQLAISKGIPKKVDSFDALDIKTIFIGLRHSAALSSKQFIKPIIVIHLQIRVVCIPLVQAIGEFQVMAMSKTLSSTSQKKWNTLLNEIRRLRELLWESIIQQPSPKMVRFTLGVMQGRQGCLTGYIVRRQEHQVMGISSTSSLLRRQSTLRRRGLRWRRLVLDYIILLLQIQMATSILGVEVSMEFWVTVQTSTLWSLFSMMNSKPFMMKTLSKKLYREWMLLMNIQECC